MKKFLFALALLSPMASFAANPSGWLCYTRVSVYVDSNQISSHIWTSNPQPGYGEFVQGYWRYNTGVIFTGQAQAQNTCQQRANAEAANQDAFYASIGNPQYTTRGFALLVQAIALP